MDVTLPELEQAINYWRALRPSRGEEHALSPEVDMMASLYAMMIYRHARTISLDELAPAARQLTENWLRRS